MNYYAGIDLGGTFVKGGIVDEEGNILVKDKIPTGKERPYAEIAAVTEVPVGTVKSRVSRARALLQKTLGRRV